MGGCSVTQVLAAFDGDEVAQVTLADGSCWLLPGVLLGLLQLTLGQGWAFIRKLGL